MFFFLISLCPQDYLIHRFCPSHMSEHLWVKGPFLSLLYDSGTPSHQTPVPNSYLFQHSAQNTSFRFQVIPLNSPLPIGLPIRISFLFFVYIQFCQMIPGVGHRALEVHYLLFIYLLAGLLGPLALYNVKIYVCPAPQGHPAPPKLLIPLRPVPGSPYPNCKVSFSSVY